jgi:hypothetical protein
MYNQCCGFWMFIPDLNFFHLESQILDPGSKIFRTTDPDPLFKPKNCF